MLDSQDVQAFVAVAEALSFTVAAASLRLHPSTVTRRVGRMERKLGVQLVCRTTRRVALTTAGARALPAARALLAHHAALVQAVTAPPEDSSDQDSPTPRLELPGSRQSGPRTDPDPILPGPRLEPSERP